MTSVEITCKDKSYPWLLDWLASKGARETQHDAGRHRDEIHVVGLGEERHRPRGPQRRRTTDIAPWST